jgi:hypothetical protein
MSAMRQGRDGTRRQSNQSFDARRYARNLEFRLVVAFFILLYGLGGALIWYFYGRAAALLGLLCITGGLLALLLLWAIMTLIGWWANREYDS